MLPPWSLLSYKSQFCIRIVGQPLIRVIEETMWHSAVLLVVVSQVVSIAGAPFERLEMIGMIETRVSILKHLSGSD